jgi:hypothetical protein
LCFASGWPFRLSYLSKSISSGFEQDRYLNTTATIDSGLAFWLQEQQISLAMSTYRANRLLFVGVGLDGAILTTDGAKWCNK